MPRPLILVTNDDGIDSPGLRAAAEAVADLGDLLIVAPSAQRTGAGRSFPPVNDKAIYRLEIPLKQGAHPAYKADVSPAQAVVISVFELAERPISLCLSGINYGENMGSSVTISGTIGAAIEAASFDIPALAISLETPMEYHFKHGNEVDFGAAAHFTRYFVQQVLTKGLPPGVDLLKIDVPSTATPDTPWRAGSISRQRYFEPVASKRRRLDEQKGMGYRATYDRSRLEPESDIHIFAVEKLVSVVPMTIDLTARIPLKDVSRFFKEPHEPSARHRQ